MLREGRRSGAKDLYITSDLNVELGMMCTNEKDIVELSETYGPLCWQKYDKDPKSLKKLAWYGIMKEFIQLRGHIYMVQVRKDKRDCLHAQIFESREGRRDIAAGLHVSDGISEFVEDCETGLLEENRMLKQRKGSEATGLLRLHR